MLSALHINNYALIDNIDIDFHNGFNIITGETGAGKSIMLGALSLILGERADIKAVRDSKKKSVIEAIFAVDDAPQLKEFCLAHDLEWDDSSIILRREIAPAGRSRAFINDSPVNLEILGKVAMQLIDIHSQHQNQLLAQPEFQLKIIDNLAHNQELLVEYARLFGTFRNAVKQLHEARKNLEKSRDDEEYTRFQLEQLEELHLVAGEQDELEHDRDVLANVTELKLTLNNALDSLMNGNDNALSLIDEATESCESISSYIEDESLIQRLESCRIELRDIADSLESIDSRLQADPEQLQAIEERLNSIYSLQHKHRVDSVEALIEIRDSLRARLEMLDNGSFTLEELEKEARRAKAAARQVADELSRRRKDVAERFGQELLKVATPLGMKNLQVKINVEKTDMSITGTDKVEFLFAFNKNQQLMPVGGVASGGEISRLMLSIKTIVAHSMKLPAIIFDEVDTGVSGDVANRMGQMMKDISKNIQVMAITHLPQVAAKGNSHYKVYKEDDDAATYTRIKQLTPTERIDELAVMLSGSKIDGAARANAESLLRNNS